MEDQIVLLILIFKKVIFPSSVFEFHSPYQGIRSSFLPILAPTAMRRPDRMGTAWVATTMASRTSRLTL